MSAVAALQQQVQGSEARASSAEQAAAALQQDVVNWQGRYKKKDAELASQAAKVLTVSHHSHNTCVTYTCTGASAALWSYRVTVAVRPEAAQLSANSFVISQCYSCCLCLSTSTLLLPTIPITSWGFICC